MITAILDTNVIVQTAIGHARSSSLRVLRAYDDGRFRLVLSPERIDEYLHVLVLPDMRQLHGWSDEQILRFVGSLSMNADFYSELPPVPVALARDVTDVSLLALASTADADFLVTNDRRHLLRLKAHGRTRIVTPAAFLKQLPKSP